MTLTVHVSQHTSSSPLYHIFRLLAVVFSMNCTDTWPLPPPADVAPAIAATFPGALAPAPPRKPPTTAPRRPPGWDGCLGSEAWWTWTLWWW